MMRILSWFLEEPEEESKRPAVAFTWPGGWIKCMGIEENGREKWDFFLISRLAQ